MSTSTTNQQIFEHSTIKNVLPLIDDETWLLLDLDNTVFQASQALGHVDWLYHEVGKLLQSGMSSDDAYHSMYPLWKKTQSLTSVIPVEDAMIDAIHSLQAKGITIIGITHRESFLANDTFRQLHAIQVDFLKTAPSLDFLEVQQKPRAVYQEGILFVNSFNEKSDIFKAYITKLGFKPKKVIFLDDKLENVEEFTKITSHEEIQYTGVHYTGAHAGSKIFSPEVAELQLRFLDKIVSNEDAELLLKRHSHSKKLTRKNIPDHFYKVISYQDWQDTLHLDYVPLKENTTELLTEDQISDVLSSDNISEPVILKIASHKLIGRIISSPSYLLEGSIPIDAIIESRIYRS